MSGKSRDESRLFPFYYHYIIIIRQFSPALLCVALVAIVGVQIVGTAVLALLAGQVVASGASLSRVSAPARDAFFAACLTITCARVLGF